MRGAARPTARCGRCSCPARCWPRRGPCRPVARSRSRSPVPGRCRRTAGCRGRPLPASNPSSGSVNQKSSNDQLWNVRWVPTRPLLVSQPVGMALLGRHQEQARRADGVRGHHDDLGTYLVPLAGQPVNIGRPGDFAVLRVDTLHPGVRPQVDAIAQRFRPVCRISRRDGIARAPAQAEAARITGEPRILRLGEDRVLGPPTSASRAGRTRSPSCARLSRPGSPGPTRPAGACPG